MSSKTKIVVLRMKEIIYTAIFLILGILLISLFLFMFRPERKTPPPRPEYGFHLHTGSIHLVHPPGK